MDGELKILNKYLKKMFPFIVEVDSVLESKRKSICNPHTFTPVSKGSLKINIYSTHYL